MLPTPVREVLRQRLRARPEAWRRAHERAAAGWRARHDAERTFHHLIEAGEIDQAIRVLVGIGYAILTHNRIYALERLIGRLPAKAIEADPWLRFCRGSIRLVRMQMAGARADARGAAELADAAGLSDLTDAARSRLCCLAAWQGDFPTMAREAARIGGPGSDLDNPIALAGRAMLEMACRHLGRNDEADALAAEIDSVACDPPAALAVDNTRAMISRLHADYEAERACALRCLAGAREGGAPGGLALGLLHSADALRNLGRPEEALEVADEAAAVCRSMRETWWEFTARNVRIAALRDLERFEEAQAEGRALVADCRGRGALHWVEGEVWLTLGSLPNEDHQAALAAARRAAFVFENPVLRAQVLVEIARDAALRGDVRTAEREISRAQEELGSVRALEVRSSIRLLRARMAIERGRPKDAQAILADDLREGPALRRERRALLPALLPLALDGSPAALAQVDAEGVAALPALSRIRSRAAGKLRARLLDAAAGPIDVESLGAFRVLRRRERGSDGDPIRFRTPRVAELFRLLLVAGEGGESVPRDALIEAVWPESGDAHATFHTHLAQLRRELARLFAEVSLAASRAARKLGDLERARAHLERLVSEAPEVEMAYGQLMELAAERGRSEEIPSILDRCRAALRAELDREPAPETESLAARLTCKRRGR